MDTIEHFGHERWEFRCERGAAGWRWRRRAADGVVSNSTRAFASLDEALADAVLSGFTYAHSPARA